MSATITKVDVFSYPLGTGDFLLLKFEKADNSEPFKILIDAGSWSGKYDHVRKYVKEFLKEVNNEVDILIATHEHKDHVYAFQAAKEMFTTEFKAKEIWLGWTENDSLQKVKRWKKDYGQKKMALARAVRQLEKRQESSDFEDQFSGLKFGHQMIERRRDQLKVIQGFAAINLGVSETDSLKSYAGDMEGMRIVKKDIDREEIRYFTPGKVVENHPGAPGLKFYILGPPKTIWDVRKENSNEEGESYEHSHNDDRHLAFETAINDLNRRSTNNSPFKEEFADRSRKTKDENNIKRLYQEESWRKIDDEWLYATGSMALRMNSLTNNLSLALAIEIEESGRVLLFPGDAEYGSWKSWHKIDWESHQNRDRKHLTEDLLNRTCFYKVSHHMSHNGTAQRLGLNMMTSDDLVALATLDYQVISGGWTNTMPNRYILDELLQKTKGRIIFNNLEGIPYDDDHNLEEKLEAERSSRLGTRDANGWKNNYEKVNFGTSSNPLFYHKYSITI